MTARSVVELPSSDRWTYEPKFDGWRCLAFRQPGGRVILQSRQQRWLTTYFPDVVAALQEQLAGGVVLDGEFVVCTAGRLDFAACLVDTALPHADNARGYSFSQVGGHSHRRMRV